MTNTMATPDRRSILIDADENVAVIVSGIDPDQLRDATPCRGYDVAGLIDHVGVHAWDLARATGQLDRLASTVAAPALSRAHAFIKQEFRDMVGPGAPFGAEVPPPPGANDWERFVAFTGRDPRARVTPSSWREKTTRRMPARVRAPLPSPSLNRRGSAGL